ncbi:MAG: nitrilase-related carbon-nitrogen hydrolase [Nitrospinales bacterium]
MKVGFIQNQPKFGDIKANCEKVESLLGDASADLLVLPELFATGYQMRSIDEAKSLAESIPGGFTSDFLISLSKSRKMTIVAGLAEKCGDVIYNSAVVTGPEGYIGKYRKAHIFDTEKEVFTPGDLPFPVFDIGSARLGVMICFDWRFPETARTLMLKGADIIVHPSNLVLPHCPQAMITRCLENRVFAITADRVGKEERISGQELTFIGQSQVVDPDGNILYRASVDKEELKIVDIDISKARDKTLNPRNDIFKDRREDLYR